MRWAVVVIVAVILASAGCGKPAAPEPAPAAAATAVREAIAEGEHAHAHEHAHGHEHEHGNGHEGDEAAGKPSGESIYQLESVWTDQAGKPVSLRELGGKPVVLAMVYTHCQHACPRIVMDMKAIEAGLTEAQRKDVSFVLASIDPEHDTVARLQTFAQEAGLTAPAWRLLRSDPGAVRELAAVLGLKYRATSATDYVHSNLINVLDRGGLIVHQQEGLGVDPKATLTALEQALRPLPPKASTR